MRTKLSVVLAVCSSLAWPAAAQTSDPLEAAKTLHIGFFGDVKYQSKGPAVTEEGGPGKGGFNAGGLDLYVTSQLSEHWSGLVETNFETEEHGIITDVERCLLTYGYSDALQISGGRMHNPLIRWNAEQHQGAYVQTPIDRPSIAKFEDEPGLWPVRFVGVMVSGQFNTALTPRYALAVSNGRGDEFDEVQATEDRNNSKAVLFSVGIAPAAVQGLELDLNGYTDKIPSPAGTIDEHIGSFSASYVSDPWELRGEWSKIQHKALRFGTQNTSGWYVMGAMRLPGNLRRFQPYVMIDRLTVPAADDYFEAIPGNRSWIAGLRWDMDRWVALKADYRNDRLSNSYHQNAVRFQLAFSLR